MVAGAFWLRSRAIEPAAMLKRLPTSESVVLFVNMRQLRDMGLTDRLFDNASVGQDPEYQTFVQKIDFNFRTDLDAAMLALSPSGKYMLLKGRFDWNALTSYATSQGGMCNNAVCNMVGTTPDRRISFFPLQKGLMALAVTPQPGAADRMNSIDQRPGPELPQAPIWLMIPQAVLRSGEGLPTGTRMFADKLSRAQLATLWVTGSHDKFAARMEVSCQSIGDAVAIASDLGSVTHLLTRMIEAEHQIPNPADLSGFLTSGRFHNEGTKVIGEWPIHQALLETLFGK